MCRELDPGLYRSNLIAVGRPDHLAATRQWHDL